MEDHLKNVDWCIIDENLIKFWNSKPMVCLVDIWSP